MSSSNTGSTYDVPQDAKLKLTLRFRDSHANTLFGNAQADCMSCCGRERPWDEQPPECKQSQHGPRKSTPTNSQQATTALATVLTAMATKAKPRQM